MTILLVRKRLHSDDSTPRNTHVEKDIGKPVYLCMLFLVHATISQKHLEIATRLSMHSLA